MRYPRIIFSVPICFILFFPSITAAKYHFSNFHGRPPIHIYGKGTGEPQGFSPDEIKAIYHLPADGGKGTIAIIGAYDDKTIEQDLHGFDAQFGLPDCTVKNGCFEKHKIGKSSKGDFNWAMEDTLDVEWAHTIAPQARILLIEAATPSGANLLKAVDYAASRNDVVSVSMSWGGAEFPEETALDDHFVSRTSAVFFAASGDQGWGASWPASSPNVVSVGGTTIALDDNGDFAAESAWQGSGGGVSAYESEPDFQKQYRIPKAHGMRAIPDVAYDADPASGFSIYRAGKWYRAGGTSAGAPQWAAIAALGSRLRQGYGGQAGFTLADLYSDKASDKHSQFFRDITSGQNGDCGYYCDARKRYDYITGLGVPQTVNF